MMSNKQQQQQQQKWIECSLTAAATAAIAFAKQN